MRIGRKYLATLSLHRRAETGYTVDSRAGKQ